MNSLVVLDFEFPNLLTAFRVAEYNHYLQCIPGSMVLCANPHFTNDHARYASRYPALAPQVHPFEPKATLPACKLAYTVFLNPASFFLPYAEQRGIPLAMTLYPGGGFAVKDPASDAKLARLLASPVLRKIIVTQTSTRDYLKAKGFYSPDRVEFVYGAVIHELYFQSLPPKRRFGREKSVLDLCFVAFKYMPGGLDKGYDIFITAAKALAKSAPEVRFHVVGNFDQNDLDVRELGNSIAFHGLKLTAEFPAFYADMDMILSPNVASRFSAYQGKTDGFPTAACMEASLCGVGMLCTDVLAQNSWYEEGIEVCIVPPDPEAIVQQVLRYRADTESLARLGELGCERSRKLFDPSIQLGRRLKILRNLIDGEPAQPSR